MTTPAMNPTLALMSRSAGIWEGHYTHISPVDRSVQELQYTGEAAGERVVFDNGRIRGECWKIDADALYLAFRYTADPRGRIAEMIQVSADGRHRARTWHWFKDEELWRITLVRETRISADPNDWIPLAAP